MNYNLVQNIFLNTTFLKFVLQIYLWACLYYTNTELYQSNKTYFGTALVLVNQEQGFVLGSFAKCKIYLEKFINSLDNNWARFMLTLSFNMGEV